MRQSALFVVTAATMLAACSDSTEIRRLPEEQVLFILTGVTKNVAFKAADDTAVTTAVSGEFPLRVHLSEVAPGLRYRGTDFTVERRAGCTFSFRRRSSAAAVILEHQQSAQTPASEFRQTLRRGVTDVLTGARGVRTVVKDIGTSFTSMASTGWSDMLKPLRNNSLAELNLEVSADFSGLKSVSYIDPKTIRLDGAKFQCIGEGSSCAALQGKLDQGIWNLRSHPFGTQDADTRAVAESALQTAIKVLVSNSCQPT